jgi:type IX secretion system PorP/SprF family membrane protein
MKKIIAIIFLFTGLNAAAQDPHFSQYYQAPLFLNPGFTGITPQQRVVLNHRIQWPSLPQAFTTYAASYDIFVNELRSGFGVLFTTDKMGSAGWRSTTASLLYSYKIKLTSKLVFSPGISFGYGVNGLDRNKLRMGDGLEYDGTSLDPELNKLGKDGYLDFGSGFVLYSKNIWLGASFSHINRPELSVLGEDSRLPMKTSIHGGVKLSLHGARTSRPSYLTPSFIYKMQGPTFSQLDLGINYHIDPISVGLWYRGKPFQKSVANTVEQDAFIIFLGLYFKNLTLGYSYDFTISKLQTASGGAHEISVVYEFSSRRSDKKNKKKYKLIPCPSFNSKEGFWN